MTMHSDDAQPYADDCPPRPKLIGLAGYARVGKDSVAEILAAEHGFQRRAFADKLRELAAACNPILEAYTHSDLAGGGTDLVRYAEELRIQGYETAKNNYPEVRNFLVNLGAGARKVLAPDVWLDACLPLGPHTSHTRGGVTYTMEWGNLTTDEDTVITDVRYLNEAKRIILLGGTLWFITRPGVDAANLEEQTSIAELITWIHEAGYTSRCKVLSNNGTLENLVPVVQLAVDAS